MVSGCKAGGRCDAEQRPSVAPLPSLAAMPGRFALPLRRAGAARSHKRVAGRAQAAAHQGAAERKVLAMDRATTRMVGREIGRAEAGLGPQRKRRVL